MGSSQNSTRSTFVLLGRKHWETPIKVPVRHYKRFSRSLSRQVDQLVERWAFAAAPNAARLSRVSWH